MMVKMQSAPTRATMHRTTVWVVARPTPSEPPLKDEDLELQPMSTGRAAAPAPPAPVCGQWVPINK